jgi:murein L,D-transpeptidase YafK
MKNRLFIILILTIATVGLFIFLHSNNPIDKSIKIDKIIIEKSKRELQVYSHDKLIKTYKISLGRNSVGKKEFEGDKKTPEGQYIINDKNPNSGYYKNLGISYPNKKDNENANRIGKNPGGQIKIHGIKNGFGWIGKLHLLMDWTAGCIALTNKEIDELYEIIKVGTPVIIKP